MSLAKTGNGSGWRAIAAGTFDSFEISTSHGFNNAEDQQITIELCHKDVNADTVNPLVEVWKKTNSTDDFWVLHAFWEGSGGTAGTQALDANSGAGQGSPSFVQMAATAIANYVGDKLFLLDAGDVTNSTIIEVAGIATNDYLQHVDDLVGAYDSSDSVFDIVDQFPVFIPASLAIVEVRIFTRDLDATYAWRVRSNEGTAT